MAPLSVLGQLRHEMVRLLDAAAVERPEPRLLDRSRFSGRCRSEDDRKRKIGRPC